ncbi:MAG: hypothetical protein J1D77_05735 [Muribaculaceae bacterium]|nr:hypothetical protein [Muribaculaceae bacterium]
MEVFTQIIILLVVLACMVMVILAIRQLTKLERFEDEGETSRLKEEIEEENKIISHNSIFHSLVEAEPEDDISKRERENGRLK